MSMLIIRPKSAEDAYEEAALRFQELYERVTGIRIEIAEEDDGVSDLIAIGSDAVNDVLMREVLTLRMPALGIRYGTDDYCIRSFQSEERKMLVLAGGRGRSTLYAVYDYFERYADCHYFWDGDVIPQPKGNSIGQLPMEGLAVLESPHFFYRGLRYFAHRGLKRFQAEHWSLEDWKRELDWMVKKRLNFFMLRIGMDDIWQRAFPGEVPYPETYRTVTGVDADSYNDRSDFWTLKYRGWLREQILEYARRLDLMYPVDCGTMTHWYSRTPVEFLEQKKPSFVNQAEVHYTESDTGKVFDFTKQENMDYYMHLTDTMVKEHEKTTALFHTIGLGERRMYKEKEKNFALKLIAYRRIAENIRRRYPESKLLLASWDFVGFWSVEEVRALVRELDPERTILMDYASEMNDPEHSFLQWGVVGKFPWIFGLFHAYESESELRGPYDRAEERLKTAAGDPYCKGMILWPELAHNDPLILEFLAENAWSPLRKEIREITEGFCRKRYGSYSEEMNRCWQLLLPFINLGNWGGEGHCRPEPPRDIDLCNSWYVHQDLWTRLTFFLEDKESQRAIVREYFRYRLEQTKPMFQDVLAALYLLAEHPGRFKDLFILRDSIDLVRTVLGRYLNSMIILALEACGNKQYLLQLRYHYLWFLQIMAKLLGLTDDFSLQRTMEQLEATAPVNPGFEITLKRNICNVYCSQPAYELVMQVFLPEGEAFFEKLLSAEQESIPDCREEYAQIKERFMECSLEQMQPAGLHPDEAAKLASQVIKEAAAALESLQDILP